MENENNVNGSDVNASGSIQRVIRRVDSSSNQGLTNSEGSEDEDTVKSTARQSQLSGYKVYAFSTPLKRIFNFKLDINQANIQKKSSYSLLISALPRLQGLPQNWFSFTRDVNSCSRALLIRLPTLPDLPKRLCL